jgi:(p)ppGpp synthase/HD superfamily hydrolase
MEVLPRHRLLVSRVHSRYLHLLPETAGLSLEEISAEFGDDVTVHVNDVTEHQQAVLDETLRQQSDIFHIGARRASIRSG